MCPSTHTHAPTTQSIAREKLHKLRKNVKAIFKTADPKRGRKAEHTVLIAELKRLGGSKKTKKLLVGLLRRMADKYKSGLHTTVWILKEEE